MPTTTPPPDASGPASLWHDLAPLLDPAVNALPARDRNALLLRYFQAKPIRDVAAALTSPKTPPSNAAPAPSTASAATSPPAASPPPPPP